MKWIGLLLALVLLAVGGVALFGKLTEVREASLPDAPRVTVPDRWQAIRAGHMHALHLERALTDRPVPPGARGFAASSCDGGSGLTCDDAGAAGASGLRRVDCLDCHEPGGFTSPPRSRCEACHQAQARIGHGRRAGDLVSADTRLMHPSAAAECIACHHFDDGDPNPSAWACLDCHARPQGELPATRFHADEACSACHTPHADQIASATDCGQCHDLDRDSLAHPACQDCHSVHGSAAEAEACQDCHQLPDATFAGGHERCTQCHTPHAFQKQQAQTCQGCHRDQHALADERVPAHRRCESCHAPHDPRRADDGACKRCHKQVSDHPSHVKGRTDMGPCTACHPAHPGELPEKQLVSASRRACTACHTSEGHAAAGPAETVHHGGQACTACHAPHTFVRDNSRATCITCHREQARATQAQAGHAQCAQCHMDHPHALDARSLSAAADTCTNCHRDVHTGDGHKRCLACHSAHAGTPDDKACSNCHAGVVSRVRAGHADCRRCHDPHPKASNAELTAGLAGVPECASCHEEQTRSPHARQCQRCHDTHGGSVQAPAQAWPNCSQCHQTRLPGMHAMPSHADCKTCHQSAHGTRPPGARENCLGCHAAQRNHEPEAKVCMGCHLFK